MSVTCESCMLIARRDAGTAPIWDSILRTAYWDVVHAYHTSLAGWLVLVVRRHVEAIHELTEAEANELGLLQWHISSALKQVIGCQKTYIMQFAEHPNHPHVHFHIVPRMADQSQFDRSAGILQRLNAPESERLSEALMTDVALRLRDALSDASLAIPEGHLSNGATRQAS